MLQNSCRYIIAAATIEVIDRKGLARWQLVYQIYIPAIDTIVTGMAAGAYEGGIGLRSILSEIRVWKSQKPIFLMVA